MIKAQESLELGSMTQINQLNLSQGSALEALSDKVCRLHLLSQGAGKAFGYYSVPKTLSEYLFIDMRTTFLANIDQVTE